MARLYGQTFIEALEKRVKKLKTRVIHALDVANTFPADAPESARQELIDKACHIAQTISPHVVAIKINYPLILAAGLEITHRLKSILPEVPLIADLKVADIDNTNAWIARHGVLTEAKRFGDRGVILVVDMSHPGASQFIHPQTPRLAELAVRLNVTGVIAPGTRPTHVQQIRMMIGPNILILAPGVGAQGGKPGSAIAAGANYEIIGRSIYTADDPAATAKVFAEQTFLPPPLDITPALKQELLVNEVALLLHDVNAIKFGSFTLASGKTSPYYIDLRVIPSYPETLNRLTDIFVQWLSTHKEVRFDRIAGVPTAGISFATALSARLHTPMLYVRMKPKKYGRQQRVEGVLESGDKVLVIDDLITDGRSKVEVVQALRDAGAKVHDVLVVVDREQGGADMLKQAKLQLHALAPISQVVSVFAKERRITPEKKQEILEYIKHQSSS
jgi:uridine monophosphate synthetase